MDMSGYKTSELKSAADLDAYAVRDEAYRRSETLTKRLALANARVLAMHEELHQCGLALTAASKELSRAA